MSHEQMKILTDTFLECIKEMERRHDEQIKELMNINTQQVEMLHDLADEVKTLRVEVSQQKQGTGQKKQTKKTKKAEERPRCCAMTAKGEQCKNSAFPGKNTCQKHVNYTIPRPVASTSKTKPDVKKPQLKKKKNPPMHNHAIGEAPPGGFCKLCETHGDIFDPETPDLEFEDVAVGDKYLEERLRAMLESDYE